MSILFSDEMIMALADGELDPPLAARVREAVRADRAIRSKHEIYRCTRSVLARSFSRVLSEPVPERLEHAIRNNPQRGADP